MSTIKRISMTTLAVGATLAIGACAGTVEDPAAYDPYETEPPEQATEEGASADATETLEQTELALGEQATEEGAADDQTGADEVDPGEYDGEKIWRGRGWGRGWGGPGWHRGWGHRGWGWRGGPGWGWRGAPGWGWGGYLPPAYPPVAYGPPPYAGYGYGYGYGCDPYYGCY